MEEVAATRLVDNKHLIEGEEPICSQRPSEVDSALY